MTKTEFLKDIETRRGSRVISYITSDRPGPLNARVAMDVVPLFSNQLRQMGRVTKIDLFLYSSGGDTMVPWRLVSMIREYCDTFSVLVPYKAHSAASMIALGADEIVMSDLSELSPIDPSTANAFNPIDSSNPNNPNARIPISVEDVVAFMALAKDKFGIKDEIELGKIFMKFVDASPSIHPLALGNVNRTHNLIRLLAKRLLKSHKNKMREDEMEKVVEFFTEKLHAHTYFIGRREAKEDLGLSTVVEANADLARAMTGLYDIYAGEMGLGKTVWNPEIEIGPNAAQVKKTYTIACIETTGIANQFRFETELRRQQVMATHQTPQGPVQVQQEQVGFRVLKQGWVEGS